MTLWPRFFSQVASLPQVVVLPLPCRPDIMMTVGPGLTCMIGSAGTGAPVSGSTSAGSPSSSTSSSLTILIICWPGSTALSTAAPVACSVTFLQKVSATS